VTLRTRLIVAFLLLSVVPLGAVTFYSYTSNVEATRDVAAREADRLSTELGQRMQLITTQLSERIERLMDVSAPAPAAAKTIVVATVPAMPAPPVVLEASQFDQRVADALGAAAILLDNVQLQGGRGDRGARQRGNGRRGRGADRGATAAPGPPPVPSAADQPPTDLQIDLTEIRRALYREIVPRGRAESLTPDERQRIAREVNQRMLGIVQGIELSAAELQKKVHRGRERDGRDVWRRSPRGLARVGRCGQS